MQEGGKIVTEFDSLTQKAYSYLTYDKDKNIKGKKNRGKEQKQSVKKL